jgi:hypothetical protein
VTTPVLLVANAAHWFGTARIPRALAKAGFEVALLAPRNSLAQKSRHVAKIGYLPEGANELQWVHAFAAMVEATSPRLVLPCDDMAYSLLSRLVLFPPAGMQPALQQRLDALVRESLGDPTHYRTSVDKTLLPAAAAALGIRVPAYRVVGDLAGAAAFVADRGYPVVLKLSHGYAGRGVAICRDAVDLTRTFAQLAQAGSVGTAARKPVEVLVQSYVAGHAQFHSIAAWRGAFLGGWAADKLVASPAPTGPGTVSRYHRSPEVRGFVERLVAGFGITGLLGSEFIVEEATGDAYLLEINRRIGPATHRGALLGVDLCAALHAALHGRPSPSRSGLDPGEEGIAVMFPQEWLRDPDSHWLREYPVDVPWDEPELLEAMLALRHER